MQLTARLRRLNPLASLAERHRFWQVPDWLAKLAMVNRLGSFAMLTIAVALWIMIRHYDGIRHDGMFYAGQTMVRLGDANVASDLFFRFGSQDQYSIFSYLNAAVVRVTGWAADAMGSVLLSQIAFLAATILLLLEFAPMPLVALGLALCALHPFYGPYNIFSIGEPFTTARSIAEPFLLFAILALLRRKMALCLTLMVIGTAMHPLLALPVWFVVFLESWSDEPHKRRWWLVGLGLVLLATVVAAFVEPQFFFSVYDEAWTNQFMVHTSQVIVQAWDVKSISLVVFDLGVCVLTARTLSGRLQRFLLLVSLALVLSFLIAAWGAGIFHSVLITEVQIWRAEALAHVFAAGLFPFLLWQLRGNGLLTLVGAVFVLFGLDYQRYDTAVIATILGMLCLAVGNRVPNPTRSFQLLAVVFVAFMLVAGFVDHLNILSYSVDEMWRFSMPGLLDELFSSFTTCVVLILAMALLAAHFPRVALVASCATLVWFASYWDHRTPFQKFLEAGLTKAPAFRKDIPEGSTVFWSDDLRLPWFVLDRPSYFSINQSAGLVFNRGTAMAFQRHGEVIDELKSSINTCEAFLKLSPTCTIDYHSVRDACDVGGPDFVILTLPVEDELPPDFIWNVPLADGHLKYNVFRCASVRQRFPAESNLPDPRRLENSNSHALGKTGIAS